jgi:hypothetical protein
MSRRKEIPDCAETEQKSCQGKYTFYWPRIANMLPSGNSAEAENFSPSDRHDPLSTNQVAIYLGHISLSSHPVRSWWATWAKPLSDLAPGPFFTPAVHTNPYYIDCPIILSPFRFDGKAGGVMDSNCTMVRFSDK